MHPRTPAGRIFFRQTTLPIAAGSSIFNCLQTLVSRRLLERNLRNYITGICRFSMRALRPGHGNELSCPEFLRTSGTPHASHFHNYTHFHIIYVIDLSISCNSYLFLSCNWISLPTLDHQVSLKTHTVVAEGEPTGKTGQLSITKRSRSAIRTRSTDVRTPSFSISWRL
jgi:hypothetical protein